MKKRIIALLCAFVMLAGMLAGCGGKQETTGIKTPGSAPILPSGKSGTEAPAVQPAPEAPAAQPVEETYTVYVQAYSGWGTPRVWAWSGSGEGDMFASYPGGDMRRNSDGWYYLDIPVKYDYVAINGNDGDIETEDEYTGARDTWFTIDYDGYYVDTSKPSRTVLEEPTAGYIEELEGQREKVHMTVGSSSLNVTATVYDQTIYNCTEMTISMEVEMNAGTSCKDWQVWGRSGGSFVKLGQIYLAAGNGFTSQTLTFNTPVTFDAIVITPTVPGGYSWSMGFIVTDVWYEI